MSFILDFSLTGTLTRRGGRRQAELDVRRGPAAAAAVEMALDFGQDVLVYMSVASVLLAGWFLNKTRWGLLVRAVGENHDAAHAIGHPVNFIRMMK